MSRPRPPHLHREVTRHKRPVWYVRVGKGPRIRIRAEYGTSEFDAEYQAAISGSSEFSRRREKASAGSLAWLIERASVRHRLGCRCHRQHEASGKIYSAR